jgi:hypothetical protein
MENRRGGRGVDTLSTGEMKIYFLIIELRLQVKLFKASYTSSLRPHTLLHFTACSFSARTSSTPIACCTVYHIPHLLKILLDSIQKYTKTQQLN